MKSWSPEPAMGWSEMITGAAVMLLVLGGLLVAARLAARALVRRWSSDGEFEDARGTVGR